jgi:hydroxymethylpyrimidine/phosphomethylpyrimidine kinase
MASMLTKPQVVLTVAGFDPSSGAGITADLKVAAAHGHYGVCCPTVLTVQSTLGVFASQPVQAQYVSDTLDCLTKDVEIAALKIGALGNEAVLMAVSIWLREQKNGMPVVLDPVLRSSSGHPLLEEHAIRLMCEELLPLVSVITPNVMEASTLSGRPLTTPSALIDAAAALLVLTGSARKDQPRGVVITGGDKFSNESPDDYLVTTEAPAGIWLKGEWINTRSTHGTGCAFSTAIACGLASGQSVKQAVSAAKAYVQQALFHAYPIGSPQGHGPLHHLYRCDESQTA